MTAPAGFPKETGYSDKVVRRTVDNSTASGFQEDTNVYHSFFRQLPDGWTLTSGHNVDAWLDRFGRVHTVSYRFELTFSNWESNYTSDVVCHEFGDLVVLCFSALLPPTNATAAVITSSALPVSLRPTTAKYGSVIVMDNATPKIGSYKIKATSGVVEIYAGNPLTAFTAGAAAGFGDFTAIYDKRV